MAIQDATSRLLAAIAFYVVLVVQVVSAADDTTSGCTLGTVEDNCVSASDGDEFYFCTDRYSWEWSEDVEQLPMQASDSLCLTMDSNVISDLPQTELLVLGGCDAEYQEIGGYCESLSTSTRTYNPTLDRFDEGQSMPTQRFRAAAVNVSEHVYLFGGRNGNDTLTCNVDRYDAITREWTALDVTQEDNCFSDHSGVASDDGTIYLFGGYDSSYDAQDTVVKVEITGDVLTFSTSEPLGQKRGDHSCIRLPATSQVFCMGGFTNTGFDYSILQSVERFDIATEEWEFRTDMVTGRGDFGAGIVNGRITVVGGEDEEGPMDDVEWYDPDADCWTDSGELFDLPYKRLRYCATTLETADRIYIFGGQAASDSTDDLYTIKDTVNWYQEVLVDQLSPNEASPSFHGGAGFALAKAIGVAGALLLARHG